MVSAQTWLAVIHLMAGPGHRRAGLRRDRGAGLLGIRTLWLFLIGLPVLVAALWLGLQFGRAERARFLVMLGVHIPAARIR